MYVGDVPGIRPRPSVWRAGNRRAAVVVPPSAASLSLSARECVLCFRSLARWWLPCPRLARSPSSPSALAFAGQALPPTPLPHAQSCFLPSSRPPITPQAAASLHACPFICWTLFSLALPLWNLGDSAFLFVALGCDLLPWGSYSHLWRWDPGRHQDRHSGIEKEQKNCSEHMFISKHQKF